MNRQFNENFNMQNVWQILFAMIDTKADTATFFVNKTRYFLAFSLLKNEYHLRAFLPHETMIMKYSHETKQGVANNFVGECFVRAFGETALTIKLQQPELSLL